MTADRTEAEAHDIVDQGRWEASEDRRIARLMRQERNRAVLESRARVTEALADEVERLRALLTPQRSGCPTADRTEAAAKALVMYESSGLCDEWPGPCADCDCFRDQAPADWAARDRGRAQSVLAAADAHDRANGIARLRLDEELVEKIARMLHDTLGCCSPSDACPFGPLTTDQARVVIDLLRNEAL